MRNSKINTIMSETTKKKIKINIDFSKHLVRKIGFFSRILLNFRVYVHSEEKILKTFPADNLLKMKNKVEFEKNSSVRA